MRTNPVIKYWAIALMGMAISFLLFFLINDKKVQKNNATIADAISKTELKISDELHKIHLVIESMAFFFENTPNVSEETFQRFTSPFIDDLKGIKALEWVPRITKSEKSTILVKGKKIKIKEADPNNYLVPTQERELYYPVAFISPQKHDSILGFDLYSEPIRRSAISHTSTFGSMAFTGPINLVNDESAVGILAMKKVSEKDGAQVKGLVAGVYRMDQFLRNTLSTEMDVLDITINDQLAKNSLLFTSLRKDLGEKKNKAQQKLSIKAANRIWHVSFYPKKAYVQFPHTAESYFVLLLGLTITLLLIINIKGRDSRSEELEKKVWHRTKELEISNKQKENLLREIHHRVMNNLQITSSLINLQKRKLQDEEAIYALSSSQDRINAIAMIHKKIYQHDGIDAVDLKGYLENLIHSHKRISPNVEYIIDCPEVFIDLDSAVPLAIITSEIVVNALKHAFSSEKEGNQLYILVTPMKDDIVDIVISDNGKGLPENSSIGEASGLGYDIVKKLCRQLEADYELSSSNSGTAFSLRFKQRKLQMPVFAQ